jgi:hypothetical protein
MRSLVSTCLAIVLCGCPGEVVEGSGSGVSDGDTSTGDDGATMTMSGADTMTVGSQSQTDTMTASDGTDDGPLTMTEPTTDPTKGDTGTDTTATESNGDTTSNGTTDDGTTTDPTTGEPVCEESDENAGDDNDTEGSANALADIACQSSTNVDGVADGDTGPDWFFFHGAYDELACGGGPTDYAEPRVVVAAGGPLNVCVYATCPEFGFACAVGMSNASPDGRQGCCATDDAHLVVDCDSGDEDADVWVSVDTTGLDCQPYTLTLSF